MIILKIIPEVIVTTYSYKFLWLQTNLEQLAHNGQLNVLCLIPLTSVVKTNTNYFWKVTVGFVEDDTESAGRCAG